MTQATHLTQATKFQKTHIQFAWAIVLATTQPTTQPTAQSTHQTLQLAVSSKTPWAMCAEQDANTKRVPQKHNLEPNALTAVLSKTGLTWGEHF